MAIPSDHLRNPRFRFRQLNIERILYCWRQNQSVLLTGIRRTGKSEIMKAALVRHADDGGVIGFLNVQDYVSLEVFYRDLLREMPRSVTSELDAALSTLRTVPTALVNWLRGQLSGVQLGEGVSLDFRPAESLPRYWEPVVDALEKVLSAHAPETLPVLGIDELPFMLENLIRRGVSDADLIVTLASLRKLRDAGLRMIIAGSVSMENLLTLHGIPHTVLGGLARQSILPFNKAEARAYLAERLQGTRVDNAEVLDAILDTIPDYVPEFLNIADEKVRFCADIMGAKKSLHGEVLPSIRRAFLTQFEERLTKNYPGEDIITAEQLLDAVAKADVDGTRIDGSSLPSGHRRVMQMLQYDNFLIEGSDFRWCFTLQLIRQWWRASRGIEP